MNIRLLIIMLLATIAIQCSFQIVAANEGQPSAVEKTETISCALADGTDRRDMPGNGRNHFGLHGPHHHSTPGL